MRVIIILVNYSIVLSDLALHNPDSLMDNMHTIALQYFKKIGHLGNGVTQNFTHCWIIQKIYMNNGLEKDGGKQYWIHIYLCTAVGRPLAS